LTAPQPDPQHVIRAQAEELARLNADRIWLLATIRQLQAQRESDGVHAEPDLG